MASLDIKTLFTNVPFEETIDVIINKAFVNSPIYYGFTASHLGKLLSFW